MAKKTTVKGTVKVVPKSKIKKAIRPNTGFLTEKIAINIKKKNDAKAKQEGGQA